MTKGPPRPVCVGVDGMVLTAIAKPAATPGTADKSLLERAFAVAASGDRKALAEVYDLCAGELYGLALWRTRSQEDACDVVQEVFVRLAGTRADLGAVRTPRAYLLAMTHRAAVDLMRNRRPAVEATDALVEAVAVDEPGRLDAARASELLVRLPAAQREAVYLRHFAELSFAEIARVTGVPVFTAASRYRLGVARLRKRMGVER